MRTQFDKARAFRDLHRPGSPVVMPNIWSAGTAVAMVNAGFEAIATTSGGLALDHGVRDGEVGRLASVLSATAIAAAVDIPVSADFENCFGDSTEDCASVMVSAIRAGLAGASVEDASGRSDEPIYGIDHAAARVKAAVDAARATGDLVITARAENFLHGRPDLDDTIARLKAFEAAGADVLFAPGLPDLEAIKAVCGAVSKPVSVIVYPADPSLTAAAAASVGVARISLAGALARLAQQTIVAAAQQVRAGLPGSTET